MYVINYWNNDNEDGSKVIYFIPDDALLFGLL